MRAETSVGIGWSVNRVWQSGHSQLLLRIRFQSAETHSTDPVHLLINSFSASAPQMAVHPLRVEERIAITSKNPQLNSCRPYQDRISRSTNTPSAGLVDTPARAAVLGWAAVNLNNFTTAPTTSPTSRRPRERPGQNLGP